MMWPRMLKLNLKTDAYWMDLPANVRVKVKPISTAIMSAAQSMALEDYRALVQSGALDEAIEPLRKGLSESLLIKALAQLAIVEWEGVLEAGGDNPAQVNERNVTDLMELWLVAQKFFEQYVTQFALLQSEGNVLAPAATGTSAEEAHIATSAA